MATTTIYLSSTYEDLKTIAASGSSHCAGVIRTCCYRGVADDDRSMRTIFLSYAGLDRDIATQVAHGLEGAGVKVWWDREGIGWGDNWIEKLEQALTQCGGYIILVGPSGVRRWVMFELSRAIKRHIEQDLPIFPLLLPGVVPEHFRRS